MQVYSPMPVNLRCSNCWLPPALYSAIDFRWTGDSLLAHNQNLDGRRRRVTAGPGSRVNNQLDLGRRVRRLSTLALVIALAATPVACGPDVTVANIEVTQAIQSQTNTIQLVAQRSTAVRATIGVTGSSGAVGGVAGRLHVFSNGAEITPQAGVAAINSPFTAPLAPLRANENDTLNFELPAPTGITASNNVTFRVDVAFGGTTKSLTTGSLT